MSENIPIQIKPIFCTVFDKNYLIQGLTLYRSLEQVLPDFKLYCLALDDISIQTLRKLQLNKLTVLSLADLNHSQVEEIRSVTSYGQFCWSTQPLTCRAVLDRGEPHVTYIEADSYFFSDPIPLLQEIGDRSACVTPHWYSPKYKKYETISGLYCTHFNYFKNNDAGRECLEYWRQLNFQYRKELPLSYPGQLGLNDWPSRFVQVAELQNRGAGVAPWNVQSYSISHNSDGTPTVNGTKAIFFHYHQLSRYTDGGFEFGSYPLSTSVIEEFYVPYVKTLLTMEQQVLNADPTFRYRREAPKAPTLISALLSGKISQLKSATQKFRRIIKGVYNVYPLKYFKSKND